MLRGWLLGAALVLASRSALAQSSPDEQPARPVTPKYQTLRYLEDYRWLARSKSDDPYDAIKYVPLGHDAWLTLGGQHRFRYELVEGPVAGADSAPRTSELFVRNLVHADLHLTRELRLFVQPGAHLALGAPPAQPPDENRLDLHQAFIEAGARIGGVTLITRAGRQEMALGSTRWVSVRDGTNVRQAFDLVRVSAAGAGWSSETFFGAVPAVERGVFDDRIDARDRFWGTYWTLQVVPARRLSIEAFYLGRDRRDARYLDVEGRETRHMFGTRVFGQLAGGFEYIGHALAQTGHVGDATVRAWGLAGGLWQRLPAPLSTFRVGVRGDALSGDTKRGDGRLGTFHAFFPNQTFFSALPAIYPTNLYEVHPLVTWDGGTTSVEAGTTFFFRQSLDDAIYRPPGTLLEPLAPPGGRYSGAQVSLSFGHRIDRHLAFNAEYSHFFVGPGLLPTTGKDIDFFGTWTTLTY